MHFRERGERAERRVAARGVVEPSRAVRGGARVQPAEFEAVLESYVAALVSVPGGQRPRQYKPV
jgi:hypothetical protein